MYIYIYIYESANHDINVRNLDNIIITSIDVFVMCSYICIIIQSTFALCLYISTIVNPPTHPPNPTRPTVNTVEKRCDNAEDSGMLAVALLDSMH